MKVNLRKPTTLEDRPELETVNK